MLASHHNSSSSAFGSGELKKGAKSNLGQHDQKRLIETERGSTNIKGAETAIVLVSFVDGLMTALLFAYRTSFPVCKV